VNSDLLCLPVYDDGKVCISILHPPGEDEMSGELPEERWLPTQSVSTILLSVISLLSDPNFSSPANVDASVRLSFLCGCFHLSLRKGTMEARHFRIQKAHS